MTDYKMVKKKKGQLIINYKTSQKTKHVVSGTQLKH